MIFDYATAIEQVEKLLTLYSKLTIKEADLTMIRLSGSIVVNRSAFNYTLHKEYPIDIFIPIGSEDLPTVIETANMIDAEYPHRYRDGSLCLETETAIRMRFFDGFNLATWMDEFVEPFFFSYEYYKRFGVFPFGERPHGLGGILHTYQELLHVDNPGTAITLLRYVADEEYRGHQPCLCGSGQKLRKCHGKFLFPLMTNLKKKSIAVSDLHYLRKEISSLEQSKRNIAKTK